MKFRMPSKFLDKRDDKRWTADLPIKLKSIYRSIWNEKLWLKAESEMVISISPLNFVNYYTIGGKQKWLRVPLLSEEDIRRAISQVVLERRHRLKRKFSVNYRINSRLNISRVLSVEMEINHYYFLLRKRSGKTLKKFYGKSGFGKNWEEGKFTVNVPSVMAEDFGIPSMELPMTAGAVLTLLRKRLGWTGRFAADFCGMAYARYSAMEKDTQDASPAVWLLSYTALRLGEHWISDLAKEAADQKGSANVSEKG